MLQLKQKPNNYMLIIYWIYIFYSKAYVLLSEFEMFIMDDIFKLKWAKHLLSGVSKIQVHLAISDSLDLLDYGINLYPQSWYQFLYSCNIHSEVELEKLHKCIQDVGRGRISLNFSQVAIENWVTIGGWSFVALFILLSTRKFLFNGIRNLEVRGFPFCKCTPLQESRCKST